MKTKSTGKKKAAAVKHDHVQYLLRSMILIRFNNQNFHLSRHSCTEIQIQGHFDRPRMSVLN
jgi:hypothetical protein